jgi:hypothetical protein
MNKLKCKFGLEIECGVSRRVIDEDNIGCYHEGEEITDWWSAEGDSSIGPEKFSTAVEFVSRPFPIEKLQEVIKDISSFIDGKDCKLFKNIEINESCGAHIHFSIIGKQINTEIATVKAFEEIRIRTDKIFEKELPAHIFKRYKSQYYRECADKNKKFFVNASNNGERYSEFILSFHEEICMGFEWRSFNLLGVNDWDTLYFMYKTACESIEYVLNKEFSKKIMFPHTLFVEKNPVEKVKNRVYNEIFVEKKLVARNYNELISIGLSRQKIVENIIEV